VPSLLVTAPPEVVVAARGRATYTHTAVGLQPRDASSDVDTQVAVGGAVVGVGGAHGVARVQVLLPQAPVAGSGVDAESG